MPAHILAIDQGTTSSRAIVFDAQARAAGVGARRSSRQHFPKPGWVEHDPEEIWKSVVATCRAALRKARRQAPADIAAIGITNQRETMVVWDRKTGKPIHRAIVWQDRRTADACAALRAAGHEPEVTARTGLLLDPYFSAHQDRLAARQREGRAGAAERGELAFGTVDSFLIWRLTGGTRPRHRRHQRLAHAALRHPHAAAGTTNCSRSSTCPRAMLPEVSDCAADFGVTDAGAPRRGDPDPRRRRRPAGGDRSARPASQPGMMKSTYGTGCFALLNTGAPAGAVAEPPAHHHRLPARRQADLCARRLDLHRRRRRAVAARRAEHHQPRRRDRGSSRASADPAQAVYLVPAFVGLGAPHWDADARGAIFGLTRGTTRGRARPRRAGGGLLPDPRPARGDARATGGGGGGERRCCASTAAWSPRTGPCSSSPTSSTRRSTGRRCSRRRRSAPPISPASRPASTRRRTSSRRRWKLERRFKPKMNAAERDAHLCRLARRGGADADAASGEPIPNWPSAVYTRKKSFISMV